MRFLFPLAIAGATLAIFVALALYRPDEQPASTARAEDPLERAEPEAPTRVARPAPGALTRSLPRFIQTPSAVAGSETLNADLTDAGSRQAAEAMFNGQPRDPDWAARMEHHLAQRLGPAALARLGLSELGLRIAGLECRTFGCQVAIDWSGASAARVPAVLTPNLGPVRHVHRAAPLAAAVMRRSREEGPDRRIRESFLLFYRDDLREPSAWAAHD